MLWPAPGSFTEEQLRDLVERPVLYDSLFAVLREGGLAREEFGDFAFVLDELQKRVRQAFIDGCRSGYYLIEHVYAKEVGVKVSAVRQPGMLASAAYVLGVDDRRKGGARGDLFAAFCSRPLAAKTFRNAIWPFYRRVAHFWAASITLAAAAHKHAGASAAPFPCAAGELSNFLGLALGYQELGESMKADQSRHALLPKGETVKLPALRSIAPRFSGDGNTCCA
jgi:hypothetical protein